MLHAPVLQMYGGKAKLAKQCRHVMVQRMITKKKLSRYERIDVVNHLRLGWCYDGCACNFVPFLNSIEKRTRSISKGPMSIVLPFPFLLPLLLPLRSLVKKFWTATWALAASSSLRVSCKTRRTP